MPKATIIDVRSVEEFGAGHVPGLLNIPLNELPERVTEFRSMAKPVILCCASGHRSGQAERYLVQQGIRDIYNGGGWQDVLSSQQHEQ